MDETYATYVDDEYFDNHDYDDDTDDDNDHKNDSCAKRKLKQLHGHDRPWPAMNSS